MCDQFHQQICIIENENKQSGTNAYDLQEIKRVSEAIFIGFDTILFFNHNSRHCHLFVFFVLINDNILKSVAVTAKHL